MIKYAIKKGDKYYAGWNVWDSDINRAMLYDDNNVKYLDNEGERIVPVDYQVVIKEVD